MALIRSLWVSLLLLAASPASAEVAQAAADGFMVRHSLSVGATPGEVYAAIGRIGRWWNPAHSWSGDARNLRLDAKSGGCFCERWKRGSAEHGRVIMARRDELLRLRASLGPLQDMALAGVLTFEIQPAAGGSALVVTYRVSGDSLHGLDQIAPAVDGVIGEQARRLKRFAETGKPD